MGGVFREGLLGEVDGDVAVLVAEPGKSDAKEIVHIAHEVHFYAPRQLILEPFFFSRISGVEDKIIDVHPHVNLGAGGCRLAGSGRFRSWNGENRDIGSGGGGGLVAMVSRVAHDAGEEAGVVGRRAKMHVGEDGRDLVVPVPGRSPKAIESSVEKPQFILVVGRVAHRWADHHAFVVGELCLAECILAITLLENAAIADSFGQEKAERALLKDRRVTRRLGVVTIFVVAKDHDPRFGTVGLAVLVGLDDEDAHGGQGFGNHALAAQREVRFLVNLLEYVVLFQPPFLLVVRV
jgi:hypothetical protein